MARTITIDPVTRLEGHFSLRVDAEDGRVVRAYSKGEMFRGFEVLLRGRHPMDAQQITQCICGVCPIAHGTASILAQDEAYGITPPLNGRLLRNLILAANYIQSHILHFYHLSAIDFVDVVAVRGYDGDNPALLDLKQWIELQLKSKLVYPAVPFLPRYEGHYIEEAEANYRAVRHYIQALDMRRLAHQMTAIYGGKAPHSPTLVPGGVTTPVTARSIVRFKAKLEKLRLFIDNAYLPDIVAVAQAFPDYFKIGRGTGNFMAFGVFPESEESSHTFFPSGVILQNKLRPFDAANIVEHLRHSWYEDDTTQRRPLHSETHAAPHKKGAYSWTKAPRYEGHVMEVGPLARVMVAYHKGNNAILNRQVDGLLATLGRKPEDLNSVLGRHATRALECKLVADRCLNWLDQLRPGEPSCVDFQIPAQGGGIGFTEAPRGALGHWLTLEEGVIKQYQCVVPTTWNCSPRDDQGTPGVLEQSLVDTPVASEDNPIEAARVVRSFDPCVSCSVH